MEVLLKGTSEVIPPDELRGKLIRSLREGRPLRVKLGIDPSRPDLHLGHAVVLRKLRLFQDLGHTAVLIIGDFTGRVGDPSGQSETRPFLSEDEIEANARTYFDQAGRVLDMDGAEVRRNSEWLADLTMADILRLTSAYTVARMLERDDFRARYQAGQSISVVEFLYPLLQAMDSVSVRADVEMGGTDQTFNLLVGRDIQREFGQEPQVVFTMPLLEGTDGVRKMSKSYDNYVGLTDRPGDMFGKLMRIPDDLIPKFLLLCTDLPTDEVESVKRGMADGTTHPATAKRRLAREVVDQYHGLGAGRVAEERFDLIHREHRVPDDVPEVALPAELAGQDRVWVPRLLSLLGLASSNSEGRRLVDQGGVRIDGEPITEAEAEVDVGSLLGRVVQVGPRRFVRVAGGPGV
jgi:tyrosyl-tRNA synthetase